jgi:hypothetical protein
MQSAKTTYRTFFVLIGRLTAVNNYHLFPDKYYICFMAKKKIEQLTPKQYAELRNISLQAVTECIRENWNLPAVTSVKKFGRFYLLEVDINQLNKEINK